jgi:hypothetical protein
MRAKPQVRKPLMSKLENKEVIVNLISQIE